jgi:hypothetical protein
VYLLIILVLIIWGLIVKKIFFSTNDAIVPVQPKHATKETSANKQIDTLFLNYTDPFLKKKQVKKISQNQTVIKQLPILQQVKDNKKRVPDILLQYVGYVIDKNKGATSYIIRVNGFQHTIKQGDNIDGLKLIKTTADSLFFEKNNDKYSVYIER